MKKDRSDRAFDHLSKAVGVRVDEGLAGIEKKLRAIDVNLRFILTSKRLIEEELRDEKKYVSFLESEVMRLGRRLEKHGERVRLLHRPPKRVR